MMSNFKLIGALCLFANLSWAEDLLDDNMTAMQSNQQSASESQVKIDALFDEERAALQSLRITQAESEQLKVYNRQLESIIGNQEEQMASFQKQIQDIESTQRGIMPLMERMLLGLDQFINLDVPFLITERKQRVADLRVLLLDANTSVSEKFRRVLEAFQIEIEYGRTIEAYRANNEVDQTVDFLRFGRIALYAIDLNGGNPVMWDANKKSWIELSSGYARDIVKGLRIARKQASPQLLNLAMPALGGK